MTPDLDFVEILSRQLWQTTLVLVVLGTIAITVGQRRPHLAYALWLVVLIKAVTPPLWVSNLSLFSAPATAELDWTFATTQVETPKDTSIPHAKQDLKQNHAALNDATTSQPVTSTTINWLSIVMSIWLAGSIGLAGISAAVIWFRWRRMLKTKVPAETELLALIAQLAEQLGLPRSTRVLITTDGFGPALVGFWRPTIVLPQCILAEKSPADWEPCLMHELIHLRRGDHWVTLLQSFVQIVWWFHPLVWWMNRQICQTRERCCDQESICALSGSPKRYARCLLEVLAAKQKLRPIYGFPGVRPVQITTRRLQEVMTMSDHFQAKTPLWCWALTLTLAVVILPGTPLVGKEQVDKEQTATKSNEEVADKEGTKNSDKKKPARKQLILKYGDNKPDGKKSIAGTGEMIRFELATETDQVKAIRVLGSRYGHPQAPKEDFEVTLLSEDMKEVLHTELLPYKLFKRTKKARWTHLPFKEAVDVPKNFWVVLSFDAGRTKGVFVSYDTSTQGKYSRVGTTDEDAKKTKFNGDWMVQVRLAK